MANPWFRLYSEFADDPKVLMMEEKYRYRLVVLFCARCRFKVLREKEMPFIFRLSKEEIAETKAIFIEQGFIDENWTVIHWDDRQMQSDSSKERVRRFRERQRLTYADIQ